MGRPILTNNLFAMMQSFGVDRKVVRTVLP